MAIIAPNNRGSSIFTLRAAGAVLLACAILAAGYGCLRWIEAHVGLTHAGHGNPLVVMLLPPLTASPAEEHA